MRAVPVLPATCTALGKNELGRSLAIRVGHARIMRWQASRVVAEQMRCFTTSGAMVRTTVPFDSNRSTN